MCLTNLASKCTRRPPVEALTTSCNFQLLSIDRLHALERKIDFFFFGYFTPTYSRYISVGNMQSIVVSFVFYVKVVFYMPHLSIKASEFNSQDSITSICKLVNVLVSWQRNDVSTFILSTV